MKHKADFTNVQSFEPVPTGTYTVEIEAVEEREGPSGHPYLNWTFVIVEPEEYANRKVWGITSLSPKAAFKLKEFLEACGEECPEDEDDYEFDTDDLINRQLNVVIELSQYEGKPSNKIDTFLPLA